MSSFQQSTLHSLPYDYIVLSHFKDPHSFQDIPNDGLGPSHPRGIPIRRAVSMTNISERTPLLRHDIPIPQIHETGSALDGRKNKQTSWFQVFRGELGP